MMSNGKIEPAYMRIPQLATYLQISRQAAWKMTKTEGFPICTVGKIQLIPIEECKQWIERHRVNGESQEQE